MLDDLFAIVILMFAIVILTLSRQHTVLANLGLMTVIVVVVMRTTVIPTVAKRPTTQRLEKHERGQSRGLPMDEHEIRTVLSNRRTPLLCQLRLRQRRRTGIEKRFPASSSQVAN